MTDAVGRAFQQMYDGTGPLAEVVDAYWALVANTLKDHPGVLAYFRGADLPRTGRGMTPRPRRGCSAETAHGAGTNCSTSPGPAIGSPTRRFC